jgi:Tol biopolymer transport system component
VVAFLAVPWIVLVGGAGAAVPRPGNGVSGNAAIDWDGRFVAFASSASDLVAGDTNGVFDVFVRDRERGVTERVSVGPNGTQANARTGLDAISSDGRFVVMWSDASNLVRDDTNDRSDVFVYDRTAKTTERVSVGMGGLQANGESNNASISADGRFVAFDTAATNLPEADATEGRHVYLHDRLLDTTVLVGGGWIPAVSADGRLVAYERWNRGGFAVFDRDTGTTEDISVGADGTPLPGRSITAPSISAGGRFVLFGMDGGGVGRAGLYLRDRLERTTRIITSGGGIPSLSPDGRMIAYSTAQDVYVTEWASATRELASVPNDGAAANGTSWTGSMPVSYDGSYLAYFSRASNLVPGDDNGQEDVFVRDRTAQTTELISVAWTPQLQAGPPTLRPAVAIHGRTFVVTLQITDEHQPVEQARPRCTARLAGRTTLRAVSATFTASTVRCAWTLPQQPRNGELTGSISAAVPDATITRRFETPIR